MYKKNFSNYSAFHYRSKVLESCLLKVTHMTTQNDQSEDQVLIVKGMNKLDLIKSELDMVCQAAFTEPEDQSAWWYHRFILDWAERALNNCDSSSLDQFKQVSITFWFIDYM